MNNKSFAQKVQDFITDFVFAFAMNYAGRMGRYEEVRILEEKNL